MKFNGFVQIDSEGNYYPITIHLSKDYPSKLPKCEFLTSFFHPNVYPSNVICISIFNKYFVYPSNSPPCFFSFKLVVSY
jgi:ubiquitin-protein ligase